jgi:hypothetical protein
VERLCSRFRILFQCFLRENWGKTTQVAVWMFCLRARIRVWGVPHSNYELNSTDSDVPGVFVLYRFSERTVRKECSFCCYCSCLSHLGTISRFFSVTFVSGNLSMQGDFPSQRQWPCPLLHHCVQLSFSSRE